MLPFFPAQPAPPPSAGQAKAYGAIAKRLCSGLQIRLAQFDSGSRLQSKSNDDVSLLFFRHVRGTRARLRGAFASSRCEPDVAIVATTLLLRQSMARTRPNRPTAVAHRRPRRHWTCLPILGMVGFNHCRLRGSIGGYSIGRWLRPACVRNLPRRTKRRLQLERDWLAQNPG